MIFYQVGNEDYIADHFVHEHNAKEEVEKINKLCEEYKGKKGVNTKPVYITEIYTSD